MDVFFDVVALHIKHIYEHLHVSENIVSLGSEVMLHKCLLPLTCEYNIQINKCIKCFFLFEYL